MLTSSRASVHAPRPGANRALARFVAGLAGGIALIVAFVVIGSRVAGQSSNERVIAALPDAEIADYAPSLWALAENVEALVAASDAVVIGRVTSTSFALEDREFTSGTHSFGDLTAKLRITAAPKGDIPAGTLEVRQFAHAFNGKLLIEDKNPPLQEGQAYLLFLVRDPATGVLRVGDPFIQQVIDGRVYWAGAKPHLRADDPGARPVGNDPRDPLMAFWGLTVDDAATLVRAAVR